MAELKLGKSLDDLIKENASKARGKGVRVDGGARKGIRVGRGAGGGRGGGAAEPRGLPRGMGVSSGGVRKPRAAPRQTPRLDYDEDMEDAEYGAEQRTGGGAARRGRGRGRAPMSDREALLPSYPTPKGNSEGMWTHDLFDGRDKRNAKMNRGVGALAGRLGPGAGGKSGTKLLVSNLDFKVTQRDVEELFASVGDVSEAKLHFDPSGRSEGTAHIVYVHPSDAKEAIKQYNGVKLDGRTLAIELAPAGGDVMSRLSSGVSVTRNSGGAGGLARRAISEVAAAGRMGGGGGGRMGGGGDQGMGIGRLGRMGAPARATGGGRGGRGGGRLRSGVVGRTEADLDAELNSMRD